MTNQYEVYELIDRSVIVSANNEEHAKQKAANKQPHEYTEKRLSGGVYALPNHSSSEENNSDRRKKRRRGKKKKQVQKGLA